MTNLPDLDFQIVDCLNSTKHVEVQIQDFWNIFKNMKSKFWISGQIPDWVHIMVFEMVYLLFQQVYEKTIIWAQSRICVEI